MKLSVPIGRDKGGKVGDEEVRGIKVGPLLVHPDVREFERFTVTHIQTGRAVWNGICCRPLAMQLANSLKDLDWNFTTDSTAMTAKPPAALKKQVEERLRKWQRTFHQCRPEPRP